MPDPAVNAGAPLTRRQVLRGGAGLVIGASAFGLFGCGSSSDPGAGSGGGASASVPAPTVKPKADGDLSWLSWADYVPPKVVSRFEKQYGVKVNISFMNSDQEYIQKLAAGLPFDLITTNSAYLTQTIGGKLVQTFDPADLKHRDNVIPFFQQPFYDKGKYRYSVPYGYGPTGVVYRTDKISQVSETWDDLWSHTDAKGHIYVLDQIEEAIGASLLRDKNALNSADPGQVQKAADALISLKPSLGGFSTDTQSLIPSGNLWIGHAWGTGAYFGITKAKNPDVWRFYYPKDGAPIGADTLSIGAKAKSPGTALLFMDWMLEPDNAAEMAAYALQKNGTKTGNDAFDQAVAKFPFFKFDDATVLGDPSRWKQAPTGQRSALYNQQWARIKA